MEVAWHAKEGLVIISLWTESTCRATFQLPIEDAPGVIGSLLDALGDAVRDSSVGAKAANTPTLVERLRQRFRRESAEIISLTKRQPREVPRTRMTDTSHGSPVQSS